MLINIKPLKLKAEERQSHKHLLQHSAYHQLLIWRQWKCAAEIIGFIGGRDELSLMDSCGRETKCHVYGKAILKIKLGSGGGVDFVNTNVS